MTTTDLDHLRDLAEHCRCVSCRDAARALLDLHAQGLDIAPGMEAIRASRAFCARNPEPVVVQGDRGYWRLV